MFCWKGLECTPHFQYGHYCKLELEDPSAVASELLTDRKWLCPKAFKAYFAKIIKQAKYDADRNRTGTSLRTSTSSDDELIIYLRESCPVSLFMQCITASPFIHSSDKTDLT